MLSSVGDQLGAATGASPRVICTGSPSGRLITQICGTPCSSGLTNAMRPPSGASVGWVWEPGKPVTSTASPSLGPGASRLSASPSIACLKASSRAGSSTNLSKAK
jgi:hypothetical protein